MTKLEKLSDDGWESTWTRSERLAFPDALPPSGVTPVQVAVSRKDWRAEAACRGMDPAEAMRVFFPETGRGADRPDWTEARAVCARCDVVDECLNDALEAREIHHGFVGGKSPSARYGLYTGWARRRLRNRPCVVCTTPFEAVNRKSMYCSPSCRNVAWRRRRGDAARERGSGRYGEMMRQVSLVSDDEARDIADGLRGVLAAFMGRKAA